LHRRVSITNRLVSLLAVVMLASGAVVTMARMAQAQSVAKDGPILLAKGGGGGGGGGGAGAGGGGAGAGGGGAGAGGGGAGAGGAAGGGAASGGAASGGAASGGAAGGGAAGGGAAGGNGPTGAGAASGVGGSPGPGGGGGSGEGAAPATTSYTPTPDVLLAKAQQDFARGDFKAALAGAETVVRSDAAGSQRAAAFLIGGDAAFALRDYVRASAHYTAFLSSYRTFPDAPRVAMARGWAKLRTGDAGHAHWTWSYLADEFPLDARAPLALILAAGAANSAGDRTSAEAALDRLIADDPQSGYAGAARLQRALLALERGDETTAVRQLGEVIHTHGTAAVQDHATIVTAFATPGAEAALESPPARAPEGGGESLERFTASVIDTQEPQATAPLLHGVVLVAAAERGWTDTLVDSLANRLVDDFPSYDAAPALLSRVAAAASSAGKWQIAMRDYEKIVARYGDAPAGGRARVELADAFVRAGALPQARDHLRRVALAGGEESPRAWLRLAEVSQMVGDRREALTAYERVPRTMQRTPESLLSQARLLQAAGLPDAARPVLQTAVQTSKGETASEAAYELGRLAGERGQQAMALEWFTNAIGAAPDSRWAMLALLGTGDSLAALNRKSEALTAYTKLVAAVPIDAWRHSTEHAAQRELAGEAAYRGGTLLRTAGRHGEALNMFVISAMFTKGSPAERRALIGAMQCYVAAGDRNTAEGLYRQLQAGGAEEPVLAEARRALKIVPAESALPRSTR
jgi:tetratricopeptide (TPR) repeat protein